MSKSEKIAIVTGASRGIGRAISLMLLDQGYKVIGIYKNSRDKAKELEALSKNLVMYQTDLESIPQILKFTNTIKDNFDHIDLLVNNAGIHIGGNIEDYLLKNWEKMHAVNVTAKVFMVKELIPLLKKSTDSMVVNISSRGGLNEYVFSGSVPYCMNNAAINNFTVALAKELKPYNIRVNAVIPTVTRTDRFYEAFTPKQQEEIKKAKKLGETKEVATLVLNLINDKSITGSVSIDERVHIKTKS